MSNSDAIRWRQRLENFAKALGQLEAAYDQDSYSDMDIALFGDELTLTDHAGIAEAIDELPIPQRVDLLLHKTIRNKNLLKDIEMHGMEWYRKGGCVGVSWSEVTFGDALLNGTRNGI